MGTFNLNMMKKTSTIYILCITTILSALFLVRPSYATATEYYNNGTVVSVGNCILTNNPAEANASHVYTLNPDFTLLLNQSYLDFWGRNAGCNELQFHVNHNTPLPRLKQWLRDTARGWFEHMGTTHYEGQTLSTSRHEFFLVKNGVLHRVPDWLTALSWGLLISDRYSIGGAVTDVFYQTATFGAPLQYTQGKYVAEVEQMWKHRIYNYTRLPTRLSNEIKQFTEGRNTGSIFLDDSFAARYSSDPYAQLYDWDWMTNNPQNFTVAFFGDQGITDGAKAVLGMIKEEGAEMFVHLGDFDYLDNPTAWEDQINAILGEYFPYFAVIGNHDVPMWAQYQQKLNNRISRIPGASCQGEAGINASCQYAGLHFILSGIGTAGTGHETFIQENLASSTARWKICAWHKDQRLMQVGGKSDETGWTSYELCRQAGAIIATAHEHSYERTHLMSDFTNQIVEGVSDTMNVRPGSTFAFVSGLGGYSIRSQVDSLANNPWWASVYTSTQNANYGALLCTFNYQGERKAHCYFKDINGNIPDTFDIIVP